MPRDPERIARARALRKGSTATERALWRTLRRRQLGGFKFRRQEPVGPFVVDFVCLEARVVIEVDGGGHAQEEQTTFDENRTRQLEEQGFRVLRFWNHEVLQSQRAVLETIEMELKKTPSP